MADLSFSVIFNKSQGIFAACRFTSSYSSPDTWSSISKEGQSPLQHRKLHYSLSFWSGFAACIKFSAAMATQLFAIALVKLMPPELHEYKFEMQLWLHINTYFKCSRVYLYKLIILKMLWVKKSYNEMQAKKYRLLFETAEVERNLSVAISNCIVDNISKGDKKVLLLYWDQTSMVRDGCNYYSCLFSKSIHNRIIFMSHLVWSVLKTSVK